MSEAVEKRNSAVLEAAVTIARDSGFASLTRDGIAEEAGVGAGSVNNAYGTMDGLKKAVMAACVEREHLSVIAWGIANGYEAAKAAPEELRKRALASLATA